MLRHTFEIAVPLEELMPFLEELYPDLEPVPGLCLEGARVPLAGNLVLKFRTSKTVEAREIAPRLDPFSGEMVGHG